VIELREGATTARTVREAVTARFQGREKCSGNITLSGLTTTPFYDDAARKKMADYFVNNAR